MMNTSFTVAPRQRNTREENKKIKEGNGDEKANFLIIMRLQMHQSMIHNHWMIC